MLSLEVLIKVSIFCQHIYEWEHRFHISHVTIPASGPHTVLGTIHSIQQMILCKMSTFLGPFHTALTLYNQTPKFSVSCTTESAELLGSTAGLLYPDVKQQLCVNPHCCLYCPPSPRTVKQLKQNLPMLPDPLTRILVKT